MNTFKERLDCHLEHTTKNRYKVIVRSGMFQKYHAKKIPGCYYSGTMGAWVFPASDQNRKNFDSIFGRSKLQKKEPIKVNLHARTEISEFRKYLETCRYSSSTINTYVSFVTKFFDFFPARSPDEIGMPEIDIFNHRFIVKKGLSGSYQNQFISAIKKFYERIHHKKIILEILGHMSSKTTEIYTHVSTKSIRNVISPFEDV